MIPTPKYVRKPVRVHVATRGGAVQTLVAPPPVTPAPSAVPAGLSQALADAISKTDYSAGLDATQQTEYGFPTVAPYITPGEAARVAQGYPGGTNVASTGSHYQRGMDWNDVPIQQAAGPWYSGATTLARGGGVWDPIPPYLHPPDALHGTRLPIRKINGWISPRIRPMEVRRVLELSLQYEQVRRRLGIAYKGRAVMLPNGGGGSGGNDARARVLRQGLPRWRPLA